VIRTEKRRAINDKGDPLFMPRLTKLMPVRWEEKHTLQKKLYESVTEYVRLGYNQAMRQNRQYLGFLMILMQRLVTSSTQAIASALERRLEALQATNLTTTDEEPPENNVEEEDSQEQLEELLAVLQNEKEEVKMLLEIARHCRALGPDARAETLLGILYETQREENDPELKYLIFTEFVPTQNMLRDFLEQHGFSVVCLNGSMDLEGHRRCERIGSVCLCLEVHYVEEGIDTSHRVVDLRRLAYEEVSLIWATIVIARLGQSKVRQVACHLADLIDDIKP
jgi:SNF2 family DNA or RNA helicase